MSHIDTGWRLVSLQQDSAFLLSLCVTFIFMFANGHLFWLEKEKSRKQRHISFKIVIHFEHFLDAALSNLF